jgi:hypothetical protein
MQPLESMIPNRMQRVSVGLGAFTIIAVLLFTIPARADSNWWGRGWALTGFGGVLTTNESSEIWFEGNATLEDVAVTGLAVSKQLFATGRYLDWEFEQQVVKHFGDQDHWEFNSLLVVRWETFPWDEFIDTSIAFGEGISVATEKPEMEVARYGSDHSSAVLNFVLLEVSFALPDLPGPELVARFQHRSGAFATINDTRDASTFFGSGIRWKF